MYNMLSCDTGKRRDADTQIDRRGQMRLCLKFRKDRRVLFPETVDMRVSAIIWSRDNEYQPRRQARVLINDMLHHEVALVTKNGNQ